MKLSTMPRMFETEDAPEPAPTTGAGDRRAPTRRCYSTRTS